MADLADELLADLAPEEEIDDAGEGSSSLSEVAKGKRRATDAADLDDLDALGADDEGEEE